MAKPRWLLKPVKMFETTWGFIHNGQGIIYDYNKSTRSPDIEVRYLVLARNPRIPGENILIFHSKYMSMSQVRNNTEIMDNYSLPIFKRNLIKQMFKNKPQDLDKILDIIKRSM